MKTSKLGPAGAAIAAAVLLVCNAVAFLGCGAPSDDPVEPVGDVPGVQPVGEQGGDDVKPEAATAGGACAGDADCVAAECCHAKTCTTKDNAPDCSDMMCTLDCRGGTMDCGWGKCVCKDGQCAAEINPPPQPPIHPDPKMGVKPLPE